MTTINIAVSGARGFVGARLCEALAQRGYVVWPLVRREPRSEREIFYDYEALDIELDKLAQCVAVIHLAGKNLFGGAWTPSFKEELYDSRIKSTRFIAHSLTRVSGPRALLNASAIGFYGDRGDEILDEDSSPGEGFLAELCADWERSTLCAQDAGVRVVKMRFGMVLDQSGGMLAKLLPFFKLGLGAYLGDGRAYFPYVSREELVNMIIFLLEQSQLAGPFNLLSPEPTTTKTFAQTLSTLLGHKHCWHLPSFLSKVLGEQGQLLLNSTRAYPRALISAHYPFTENNLESTLKRALGKPRPPLSSRGLSAGSNEVPATLDPADKPRGDEGGTE